MIRSGHRCALVAARCRIGNHLDQTAGSQTTTYAYDTAHHNRLVTTSVGGLVTEGFWHNDLGQLVVDGRGVYTYTPTGLLETAQMGSGLAVTHRYDADGMRAVKTTGSVPHYYVHGPGGQLLAEYEEAGGQLVWDVDYLYAGSRLLAAVRPDVSYTVSVTKAGTGSGTVTTDPPGLDCGATCSAPFAAERSLTFTAVPAPGSGFTGWSGACAGTSPTIALTVTGAAACTATFSSSPTLVVTGGGSGAGSVGFAPAGTACGTGCATFAPNTQVTLSATPAAGSTFAGWSGDADCADGRVSLTTATSCTATFDAPPLYTLTIQKTGDGSSESFVTSGPSGISCGSTCAASFASGATVQLAVDVADGFEFVAWQGTGCTTGTVSMTGARTCTAVLQAVPVSCDPDGSQQMACEGTGGRWDDETCSCQPLWEDPLVLTLDGKPVPLTDGSGGVAFDLDGSGIRRPVAWTQGGSTAAFLVLDLDGDGQITTGAELFGMPVSAPRHQKPTAGENSFTLVAAYDAPALGGNGDGVISAADAVFGRLRVPSRPQGLLRPLLGGQATRTERWS